MPIPNTMMTHGAPTGRRMTYLIPVLTILVVASIGTMFLMLARIGSSNAAFRSEVAKDLLVSDMSAAVQEESSVFGKWAASADGAMDMAMDMGTDVSGEAMTETAGSEDMDMGTEMGMDVSGEAMAETAGSEDMAMEDTAAEALGPLLASASERFEIAATALRELQPASEQSTLDMAITAHALLMGSSGELDRLRTNGGQVMATYHSSTQLLEADLRETLDVLRTRSAERVEVAINESTRAERVILVLLPILALAALASAFALSRMMRSKRRAGALEQLVQAKDEFIASVSHELRTPLTGVVGFALELEERIQAEIGGDTGELMSIIAGEAQQAAHLVEDLLVASRADIGKVDIFKEASNLRELAEGVLHEGSIRRSEKLRSIEVDGIPVVAYADPHRVRQIVRNLLTNAERYGGDTVSLNLDQHNGVVALRVVDNGPGVPPDRQETIFEAYGRATVTGQNPNSIGLGLSVARQLARLMDGDLTYSYEDDLSVFELKLPTGES